MLTDKTKQAILELQKRYPRKRFALIPALHIAQAEKGYLSRDTQLEVAELFDIELTEVHGVVTFYDMFHEEPVGKHLIHVCKNVSCMLRGCDELIQKICEKLDVKPHERTKDGEFTVIPCECLGACDRAPMMIMDDEVVGPVKLDEIDKVLMEAKKRKGSHSPITADEVPHG